MGDHVFFNHSCYCSLAAVKLFKHPGPTFVIAQPFQFDPKPSGCTSKIKSTLKELHDEIVQTSCRNQ